MTNVIINQIANASSAAKRPSALLLVMTFWTILNSGLYFLVLPFRIAMSREEEIALMGNDWLGAASDFYIVFLWMALAVVRMSDAVVKRHG